MQMQSAGLFLQVKTMTDFRRSLPEGTKTYVCKNTLLKVAADKVPGWTSLKESAQVQLPCGISSTQAMLHLYSLTGGAAIHSRTLAHHV